jgi:diguanylate cyclase (GGDEF)-like protein
MQAFLLDIAQRNCVLQSARQHLTRDGFHNKMFNPHLFSTFHINLRTVASADDCKDVRTQESMKIKSFITHYQTAIYLIFVLASVITIGIPVLQSQVIYPKFIDNLNKMVEMEAVRTGNHLQRRILLDYSEEPLTLHREAQADLDAAMADYNLYKIKVFSKSGKTIYSSSPEDIGTQNSNDYFINIVALGNTYTKVVKKNTKSLESQVVTRDVMETYIPILSENDFVGAFEIYYDITDHIAELNRLTGKYSLVLYCMSGAVILIVLIALVGFKMATEEREKFETQLLEMAHTDNLTNLCNRRRFEELLQYEIGKHLRYKAGGSILLFDIDHFKDVNDTFGHQAGDTVLKRMCQICRGDLRDSDIFARYGGEEFTVYTPDSDPNQAYRIAERLRSAIEASTFHTDRGEIKITISIGIAHLKELPNPTIETLIMLADKALYKAKKNGRNRVC